MYKNKYSSIINVFILMVMALPVLLSACNSTASTSESVASPTADLQPTPTETPVLLTPTPEPTLKPTQSAGGNRISDMDGMDMIHIPAGDFLMGSDDIEAQHTMDNGIAYPEVYMHTVVLGDYWIDKTEVTNAQYALCVAAGACDPVYREITHTGIQYYNDPGHADYPVVWVNWWSARDYCVWAGRRLPTEAEWEKAARGTDGRKYPWGNEKFTSERANFCDTGCPRPIANPSFDDGFPQAAPVGSYPAGASPYGVLDMSGNVWEWTSSIPKPYPYDANDGREDMEMNQKRIWRGGPWSNGLWYLRASVRYLSVQKYSNDFLGFRCVYSEQK